MKKEKVRVVKEKYYGFSLPNAHEEITNIQDVTVCLVLDDKGNWARGVTVFNKDEDIYDELVGRKQANQYALRALKGRKIKKNEFERVPAVETLLRTKCPFTKKGQKNMDLTMYERSLLFGKNFQEKYKEIKSKHGWVIPYSDPFCQTLLTLESLRNYSFTGLRVNK